jgi:hypothetical protein
MLKERLLHFLIVRSVASGSKSSAPVRDLSAERHRDSTSARRASLGDGSSLGKIFLWRLGARHDCGDFCGDPQSISVSLSSNQAVRSLAKKHWQRTTLCARMVPSETDEIGRLRLPSTRSTIRDRSAAPNNRQKTRESRVFEFALPSHAHKCRRIVDVLACATPTRPGLCFPISRPSSCHKEIRGGVLGWISVRPRAKPKGNLVSVSR